MLMSGQHTASVGNIMFIEYIIYIEYIYIYIYMHIYIYIYIERDRYRYMCILNKFRYIYIYICLFVYLIYVYICIYIYWCIAIFISDLTIVGRSPSIPSLRDVVSNGAMVTEAARNMLTTWSSKPRPVWPNNQEKWRIPSCYGHFDRKMMRNSEKPRHVDRNIW